jgi:pyrroline-5-carboxylate reductase
MAIELAILGAGNMAEAIAAGVIRGKLLKPEQIIAVDVSAERRLVFEVQLGIATTDDPAAAVKDVAMVLLSVKPQQMGALLDSIAGVIRSTQLIVSIAAGISIKFIESRLDAAQHAGGWRVIRTMPNTPMLMGAGMVAVARGTNATPADAERISFCSLSR